MAGNGSFVAKAETTVEGGVVHVVDWVRNEEEKIEGLVLKAKTWVDSNKIASTYLKPIITNLDNAVKADVVAVKNDLAKGGGVENIGEAVLAQVKSDVPTLLSNIKVSVLTEVKAINPEGGEDVLDTLLSIAKLTVGPQLSSIVASLV
jgi:hypothetical protein